MAGVFRRIILAIIAILLAISISGCSIIGLGVGSIIDHEREKPKKVPESNWGGIELNTRIIVTRVDSVEVTGRFDEVHRTGGDEYGRRFAMIAGADSEMALLPLPGDSVTLTLTDGRPVAGKLVGYDLNIRKLDPMSADLISYGYGQDTATARVVEIDHFETELTQRFNIALLNDVGRSDGAAISSEKMGGWMWQHRIPMASEMVVIGDSTRQRIPLDQIDRVRTQIKSHYKWLLGGIGLAVDCAAIAAAIALANSDWGFGY